MCARTFRDRNRRVYNSPAVVEIYATSFVGKGLLDAEKRLLSNLGSRAVGTAILDIGVGGGRTAPHLHAIARRYVGIDYAARMVKRCQEQFPGLEFRCCDAERLVGFEDGSFDLVWFSFNGIDYAAPDGRLRILREVHRVLTPGGVFCFSSHNLGAKDWRPRLWPILIRDVNPLAFARRNFAGLRKHLTSHFYYQVNRRREIHGPGFAVRVDQAHEYRLLTYHSAVGHAVCQLDAEGFEGIEVFGADGTPRALTEEPSDAWLYYLARKPEEFGSTDESEPGSDPRSELLRR